MFPRPICTCIHNLGCGSIRGSVVCHCQAARVPEYVGAGRSPCSALDRSEAWVLACVASIDYLARAPKVKKFVLSTAGIRIATAIDDRAGCMFRAERAKLFARQVLELRKG